ncbi:MAG: hypothetical protein KA807_18655 [Prolixibacteraceae bacterium]|jgi:hypothetical protein|nr:hypothetical protein [Prolixibacteraceae bacterium]HOT60254.1 hypothetical protein [Spirochaetales bacterium]
MGKYYIKVKCFSTSYNEQKNLIKGVSKMFEISKNTWVFLLWSTLAGAISFFIAGVIGCIILLRLDNYILETIIAGGLGGLLLGTCLGKPKMIGKIALAGLVAIPVGFWSSFILAEALFSIPFIHTFFENPHIPDIIAIIFMGVICGAIFGAIIYGRKAVWIFSAVCGIVSLPFGILVSLFNAGRSIKATFENLLGFFGPFDLNFLAIITSFGVGIGLSIGLFIMLKQKSTDEIIKA